jgi:hypothetical protein
MVDRIKIIGGVFAVTVGAAVGAGTGIASAGAARRGDEWSRLRRPLHLPALSQGQRCPTSRQRRFGGGSEDFLIGRGPAFLEVGYLVATVNPVGLDLGGAWRDPRGWRGAKAPWEVVAAYRGPILIRGARIGRYSPVGFGQIPLPGGPRVELARELHWPRGVDQNLPRARRRYRGLAAGMLVRETGCYAFQADGTTFSEVIVIRVTDSGPAGQLP